MKRFRVQVRGYDTMGWGSRDSEMIIEAENLDQAKVLAQKWCDENSFMGGYDWGVQSIREIEE